ncbi:type II secretion system F family protein [Proteiniborus sp. MB09-C3]|uniref:type II secretion system F family protein n=1 Tax=Proteiniborus sp. MB09-C3 TaxID=3050072 RepID=UPI00255346B4|nr:type II secretion system F family protein [Proteiniborus sp. MB09-C3]WIV11021.1 type II secretion system F family protein [Proteiniborus sp. MB09-C3]
MQFMYRAVTDSGQIIEGIYEANSEQEVLSMLRNNEYMPISIEHKEEEKPVSSYFSKKVTKKDIAVYCRQFYTMLNAGVSIIKCLDILEVQTENKAMRNATRAVFDDVQKGMTLSESMRKYEKVFPSLLVNMVEAGEVSGNLDVIMERMAIHYEKENKIENKVKGAMIYPIVLGVVSIAVVIFLLVAVMPTFIGMFESSGIELPAPTKLLLSISDSLKNQWYIYLASILILALIIGYFGKQESGRLFIDGLKLRIPIFKDTSIKIATSRFTRTLSTLLSSGIPLLQALDVVSKIVNNRFLSLRLENAKEEVRKGIPLSRTIKEVRVFPPMVDSMIKIGEESGSLDEILNKSADFYDEEVEVAIQKMTEMLQPLLVVFMALVVGFIVIAMALPMFDMVNTVQM